MFKPLLLSIALAVIPLGASTAADPSQHEPGRPPWSGHLRSLCQHFLARQARQTKPPPRAAGPLSYDVSLDDKPYALILTGGSGLAQIIKDRRVTLNVLLLDVRLVLRVPPAALPAVYRSIPGRWWSQGKAPFLIPVPGAKEDSAEVRLLDGTSGQVLMRIEGEQAYSADSWKRLMDHLASHPVEDLEKLIEDLKKAERMLRNLGGQL